MRRVIASLTLLLLTSCGGGDGASGTKPEPEPPASLSVFSTTVPDGSSSVDLNPEIVLYLNQRLAEAGIVADQVQLVGANGAVPISVSAERSQVSVRPRQPLQANAHYTLTLRAGIRAENGAVLGRDYVASFRTLIFAVEAHRLAPPIEGFGGAQRAIIAMGDFDGDGAPDLAVLGRLLGSERDQIGYSVLVYRQTAPDAVELVQQIDHVLPDAHSLLRIDRLIAMDIDGDGRSELVVPQEFGAVDEEPGGLQVFRRGDDGQFVAQALIRTRYVRQLYLTDVDGDGRQDLLGEGVTGTGSDDWETGFQAWLSRPEGLVAKAPTGLGRLSTTELAFTDLDRDGKADLLVSSAYSSSGAGTPPGLSVFSQKLPGEFSLDTQLTQRVTGLCTADPSTCIDPLFLDINGDGLVDLTFNYSGDSIPFLHQPDGSFVHGARTTLLADQLHAADIDNDGLDDLLILGHSSDPALHFLAAGMARPRADFEYSTVSRIPIAAASIYPDMVAAGDFTGDGYPDVVITADYDGIWLMRQIGR